MSETLATRESALTLLERHEEKDDVRNEHDAGFISGLGQRNTFDWAAIQNFLAPDISFSLAIEDLAF